MSHVQRGNKEAKKPKKVHVPPNPSIPEVGATTAVAVAPQRNKKK